jgi:hypothetical protein
MTDPNGRMTNDDNHRAAAHPGSGERGNASVADREAAARAVRDNMARLRELRLAREAAAPQPAAKVRRVKSAAAKGSNGRTSTAKADSKAKPLSAWLADQQKGGHRT